MHAPTFQPSPATRVFLPRLLWPLVALLIVIVAVATGALLWVSRDADRAAALAARERMQAVIGMQLEAYGQTLDASLKAAAGNEPLGPAQTGAFLALARPHFDATGVFTLDAEGRIVGAEVARGAGVRPVLSLDTAIVADLLGRALLDAQDGRATSARRTAPPKLAAIDGRIVAVLAISELHAAGGALAVGLRAMNREELAALAIDQAIGNFMVGEGPIDDPARGFDIAAVDGQAVYHVAWTPERPGTSWRGKVTGLVIGPAVLALLLLALAILHARRVSAELAQTQEHVQALAVSDPLSGLPNRLLFAQRLEQELARVARTGEGLAVMFLDLDRFKEVNDSFGHQAGDELIKAVARRLMSHLRGTDVLARFGGDEFAIIQPGLKSADGAEVLARRILEAIAEPFEIEHNAVTIGVSIGIALAPEDAHDRETLMRLADTALYQAKNDGRNRHSFFERRMDEAIRMRKLVADDLREAISGDLLDLYYQPIFAAERDEVVALEALLRWRHPEKGMIPPDRFVAMAEQSGLILPLGDWVLRRACLDGRRWPGLRIAVNVSPIQFRQRDYVDTVGRIIDETGFDPTRLELELTEGVVVEDADAAEAAMMQLRAKGVNLALDDFGTGYSSLIYLRRFAFDKIKIDRSFLESMEATGESAILVHSIVHLGRALGLTVTAEGVETKEQQRFLQALGCHQLQGYLLARPMPAAEIDTLLGARRRAGAA
ncbi:putative bifunctional diguanylate cyclase/phosphodiesterase [Salinarimonas chemoclinalis]|uniref:putative bifunctional diguanylate cyclase/phosphodiesterase n=1 Tax=Salinarimonas chemoclinalis TaxID=3241599 RepID=UPI003559252C